MTTQSPEIEELRALLEKATAGPFDNMDGHLIRAIRGDAAVPLFEVREVYGDPNRPAPTVRNPDGSVQFRAGSAGARASHAFRMGHANARFLAAALNALPRLLNTIEALQSRRDEALAALEPFANWAIAKLRETSKGQPDSQEVFGFNDAKISLGDLRRARAALSHGRG